MEKKHRIYLLIGFLIIILGFFIFPSIASLVFGSYVCGHYNMYLVSIAIILLGLYIIVKEI